MSEMPDLDQLFPWASAGRDGLTMDDIVASVITEQRAVPLATLFIHIPSDSPLDSISMGARIANLFESRGETQFTALARHSVDEVAGWSNVGAGSLEQLIRGLVAVDIAEAADAYSGAQVTDELPLFERPSDWIDELVADVTVLARWKRLLGDEETPLLVAVEQGEPEEVRAARARLLTLTAESVLPPPIDTGEAAELVRDALEDLDERVVAIVRDRLVADHPVTLDELGARFEVTRERIRQLEAKVVPQLRARVHSDELGALGAAVREMVGVVLPLRTLLQRFPTLAEIVPELGQPVWRVLDRFDDSYEIVDEWCVVGSMKDAISSTTQILADASANGRFAEIASVEADVELSEEWLDYAGIAVVDGIAILGRASISARAEVVLHRNQAPLSTTEIHARLGADRSVTALKNALAVDDRFTRVNRDGWGLRVWGLEGYEPIHALVGRALDSAGGRVSLQDLITALTSKFDVSPKSVVAYASGFPYVTERGVVRRRTRRDMRKGSGRGRKGLSHTKGLFRFPTDVRLRVVVNGEHLRGSGGGLPNALGEELDISIGEARELSATTGTVQLSRPRSQIQVGSVRAEMRLLGAREGDTVFYVFGDDRTFRIEPVGPSIDPRAQIGAWSGGVIPDPIDIYEMIADRIDAESATRDAIRAALAVRGDAELVEFIDRAVEDSVERSA